MELTYFGVTIVVHGITKYASERNCGSREQVELRGGAHDKISLTQQSDRGAPWAPEPSTYLKLDPSVIPVATTLCTHCSMSWSGYVG